MPTHTTLADARAYTHTSHIFCVAPSTEEHTHTAQCYCDRLEQESKFAQGKGKVFVCSVIKGVAESQKGEEGAVIGREEEQRRGQTDRQKGRGGRGQQCSTTFRPGAQTRCTWGTDKWSSAEIDDKRFLQPVRGRTSSKACTALIRGVQQLRRRKKKTLNLLRTIQEIRFHQHTVGSWTAL